MQGTDRRKALGALFAVGAAGAVATSAQAAPARHNDLARQVDMLVSRAAIEEILVAYARGNDRLDGDLLRSLFWPESAHHHGGFQGKSIDFINFAVKKVGELKYAAHHISNISIEVEGDRAFSECYYFAHHRRAKADGSEEDAFFEGRYLDDFERRAGVWKIIRRRGLSDYSPPAVPAAVKFADWPAGQHSERHPQDDYYAMRAAFRAKR